MFEYRLEHIMSYNATLAEPEVIGPLADGLRLNVYVTGGEITGPKVLGKVRPVGADWLTIRRDGIGILDVRATMETNDGALIYVTLDGTLDLGEDGYEQFLQGKLPSSGTPMANDASNRTTQLYDRRRDEVSLDEVEQIVI
jgi:Protein of unknown function (DUF3237)